MKKTEETRKGIRRSTRLAFNSKEDALKYIEETGGDTDIEESDESDEEVSKIYIKSSSLIYFPFF